MRNRYEFKIEEINNVIITEKNGFHYSTIYNRKLDEYGNPTKLFVQSYNADAEERESNKIMVICSKCEAYNVFDKDEFCDENFVYECKNCYGCHEDIVDEDTLIETINSILDEETFFDFDLSINTIPIK